MAHIIYVMNERRRQREAAYRLQRYRMRDMLNPLELSEASFIQKFRLSKDAAVKLINDLRPHLITGKNGYAVELQVLNSLRIMGSGSFQNVVAEGVLAQISQPSASRFLERFVDAVMKIEQQYVSFPTSSQELQQCRLDFYRKFSFPNVIGAIDCTHIYIVKSTTESYAYMNRKCRYSINVQMVCDSNLRIIDSVVRWPESTHDSFIWQNSCARYMFSAGYVPQPAFLLGDSGYPLEQWLLTPYRNPINPSEVIFNQKHCSARNVIERCFGLLKSRFRILSDSSGVMLYSPVKCCKIIKAAVVLHNFCLLSNVHMPEVNINEESLDDDSFSSDDDSSAVHNRTSNNSAEIIRNQIAARFQSCR